MMLSDRDFHILQTVIRAHVLTGEPVSSLAVAEMLDDDLSSATIRATFARLTDGGFLQQPHTSAGRIPTKNAYEAYAESLEQAYEANIHTLKRALYAAERLQDELHMLTGIYDGEIQHLKGFSSLLHDRGIFDEACAQEIGDLLDAVISSPEQLLELPRGHSVRIIVRGDGGSGATLLVARAGPERSLFAAGPMRMNYEKALTLLNYE